MKRYAAVLVVMSFILVGSATPLATVFADDAYAFPFRCAKFPNIGSSVFEFVSSGRIEVTDNGELNFRPPGFATVNFEFGEQEGAFFSGLRLEELFVCAFKDRRTAVCAQSEDQTVFELRVKKVKNCAVTQLELFAYESFHATNGLRAFVAKGIGNRLPN